MIYALCLVLIFVGVYGVVAKKNVVKIVLGLVILDYGVNLLLILLGYRRGGQAPILDAGMIEAGHEAASLQTFAAGAVDPLPQALVLTSIVIGLGVLAMLVALCIRLYERYGTFDVTEMRRLKG